MERINEKALLDWARKIRKQIEEETYAKAETATPAEIVQMAFGFKVYEQEQEYAVGDIRRDGDTDQPKRCLIAYNGAEQPDWTIKNGTLWAAYHGISPETAYPWEAPTGAHDMYKAGEYMTYTDEKIYKALVDTSYSPEVVPDQWEVYE